MAKGSFGDQFSSILKGVQRFLESTVDVIARDAAAESTETIQRRTRAGLSVAKDGGNTRNLKKLSRKYARYRQLNANLLSSNTQAGTSNLTFTGKLLDKLTYKRKSKGKWVVEPSSDRTKIAEYVSRARPFLFLSSAEKKRIIRNAELKFAALAKRKGFS